MIAETVRSLMHEQRLTQAELAARSGLSRAQISRILAGERTRLYLETGIALADALGLKDVRDLRCAPPGRRHK